MEADLAPLDEHSLVSCIRRQVPGADGVRFERIDTGKFNTSWFVYTAGRELVLRVAPPRDSRFLFYERDMMRQEPGIHALLLRETTVPVAPIIAYDDTHRDIPRDYLLMERLPGRPMSETGRLDRNRVLRQVGDALRQTHALWADRYGYLGEHRPMEPQPTWADAFRIMWRKLLDDIVAVGHYTDDARTRLLTLLDRHIAAFDRLVPSCLLHMDVWSQNILVDDAGDLSGLVDWDRALWGDPEIEFAVLDYCGISRPAFWEGYGTPRDESPEARTRHVFYLLYELQKYIVIEEGRKHNSAAAQEYKEQCMEIVARAFG